MSITIICKYCNHCKQQGRQKTTKKGIGRARYYCTNEKVKEKVDKYGYPVNNFVGFGSSSWESPLVLKTSPRWCPRK